MGCRRTTQLVTAARYPPSGHGLTAAPAVDGAVATRNGIASIVPCRCLYRWTSRPAGKNSLGARPPRKNGLTLPVGLLRPSRQGCAHQAPKADTPPIARSAYLSRPQHLPCLQLAPRQMRRLHGARSADAGRYLRPRRVPRVRCRPGGEAVAQHGWQTTSLATAVPAAL